MNLFLKQMVASRTMAAFLLSTFLLQACGGGSSGDDPDPVVTTPPPPPGGNNLGLDARPSNTTCLAPDNPTTGSADFELQAAFPNLPSLGFPLGLFQAPGDSNNFYVILREGRILRFANSPNVSSVTEVLNISTQVSDLGSEGGLLGLAFHPQFASNNILYLSYTSAGPNRSIISRFQMANNGLIDPNSEQEILQLTQPAGNHNGGAINFGPNDGLLYIGFGDGGSQRTESQDTNNFYGAMLRVDVNPVATMPPYYTIPPTNPFAGNVNGDAEEIFAYGFRNPFRWSFDSQTGVLWMGDVGQSTREEVNQVSIGGNYGWPLTEGFICGPGNAGCNPNDFDLPVNDYPRSEGTSVTGGVVYRGATIPALNGAYIFGDFNSRNIWTLKNSSGGFVRNLITTTPGNIVAFANDDQGEVYVITLNSSAGQSILKVVPDTSGGAVTLNVASQLSATGCFDAVNPSVPASGLIPYEVIAPLWSDGADKQRFMAIPDGTTISTDASGDFQFPVGTVLAKHFINNNIFIETRLLMHHATGWAGYSYEWDNAQTDATLLNSAKDKMMAGLQWHYPSASECRQCHTTIKDFALGPEVLQLNHPITYSATQRTANQIDTLDAIGYFSASPDAALLDQEYFALDDTSATIEQRAKSYLHSNCSQCHQPGGTGASAMDLRFETSLQNMNICSVAPVDDLGITGASLFEPGNPNLSILLERMSRLDGTRMPPLASDVVDANAVMLISDWIVSVAICP
ncbi:PQQ-dependent sugar dehydrogenase [Aurantivibrio infirmus]